MVRAPTSTPTPWPTPIPLSLTSEPGIYFVSRDGSDFRRLVAEDIFRADLSPDGTEVIYSREMEIVAMNIQTSITRVITSGPVANPMWSATGRYITFSMYGEERSAWLVRPDGSGLRRLYVGEGFFAISDWLPDDSAAFVISDRLVTYGEGVQMPPWHIFRVAPDGAISEPLAEYLPCYCGGRGTFPVVSPDGTLVGYSDHTGGVYVMNIDGTELRNLTPDAADGGLVDWMPDGNSLVYGTYDQLFRFDLASGSVTPISAFSRAVAPDGTVVRGLLASCSQPRSLVIESLDGTTTDLVRDRIPGDWFLNGAQWLPDGSGIVFIVSRSDLCN